MASLATSAESPPFVFIGAAQAFDLVRAET
jgi:hypothetical protein